MPHTTAPAELRILPGWRVSAGDRTASGRALNTAALATIGVGMCLAVYSLYQEARVAKAERWVTAQAQSLARNHALDPNPLPIDLSQSPRVLLQDGQSRLLQAPFATNDAERAQVLESAQAAIEAALAARPDWGDAQAALAYLHSLRGEHGTSEALAALIDSYRNAPYLRGAAQWRVPYAFAFWGDLPAETRASAIDEGVWFARLRHEHRELIFTSMRASQAYVPFMVRWREVRGSDADLSPY